MLNPSHRREVRRLMAILAEWKHSVPREAVQFHQVCTALEQQARDALDHLWSWSGRQDVNGMRERIGGLRAPAAALPSFFIDRTVAQQHVDNLERQADQVDDEALRAAVRAWCGRWRARLARQGAHVEAAAELEEDRATVRHIQAEVQLALDAVALLTEAGILLEQYRSHHKAAKLVVEFGGWQRQLREQGATPRLLAEIEETLAPARAVRDEAVRVEPAPAGSFGATRDLLHEGREWMAALGRNDSAVDRMDAQLNDVQTNWAAARRTEFARLTDEARALVDDALDGATQQRHALVTRASRRLRHLALATEAAGDAGAIAEQLRKLEALPIASADRFRYWLAECGRFDQQFENVARLKLADLAKMLVRDAEVLRDALAEARAGRHSSEVRRQLQRLETEIARARQAGDGRDLEAIFAGLEACDQAAKARSDILQHSQEWLAALIARGQAVRERYASLCAAAERAATVVSDLSAQIDGAMSVADPLDVSESLMLGVEHSVVEAESAFVTWCASEVAAANRAIAAAEEILLRAENVDRPIHPGPALDLDAVPTQAADAVVASRRLQADMSERLRVEQNALADRLRRAAAEMDGLLAAGTLAMEDRRTATMIVQVVSGARARATSGEGPGVVVDLLEAVQQHERFIDRVKGPEVSARERHERLEARLQRLSENGLMEFHPALTQRCSALLAGVLWRTAQWDAIEYQLEEAEALLERLDVQGRRRAAVQLDAARAAVEREVEAGLPPGRKREIERALAGLVPYETSRTLPPLAVRKAVTRLVNALPEADGA